MFSVLLGPVLAPVVVPVLVRTAIFLTFYNFSGAVSLTTKSTDLLASANALRARLLVQRADEVNHLIAYPKDLTNG